MSRALGLYLTVTFLLISAVTFSQSDTLFKKEMARMIGSVRLLDTSANLVRKQKISKNGRKIKIKYYKESSTIRKKVVVSYKAGRIYAKHVMKKGTSLVIRMTTLDDVPVAIIRKNPDDILTHKTSFIYLGNSRWYFHHREGKILKKEVVTYDLLSWR